MRSHTKTALVAAGAGVTALGVLALVVTFAPPVRAQATIRDQPRAVIRTQPLGGSAIGIAVRDLDEADVARDKLASANGAMVDEVWSGPAEKAGMKTGDVIVSFDGESVRSARQLSRLIDETPVGREVAVVVVRGGQKTTLRVTPVAASSLSEPSLMRDVQPMYLPGRLNLDVAPFPSRRDAPSVLVFGRSRLGVGVEDLTDQLAGYFGVRDGVLITRVDERTPAQAAGLQAGDVITKIGDRTVHNANDLRQALAATKGETRITIVRDKKEQTVTATIDNGGMIRRRIMK